MAKLSPVFNGQTFDANGDPAVGYKLFTYAAGSSTKQTTYTDSAGLIAQTNPIILNASGYPTNGPIWLTAGQNYKFVLASSTDTDPPTSPIKTIDNVTGVNDSSSSNTQWVSSGVTPTYVSGTSFTLPGDQTSEFHVGRRVQCTVTTGTVYGVIASSAFGALTTVTVTMDYGTVLDSGLSAVNVSILRNDNPALPNVAYCSNRNRIHNGNFQINQRTVSGAVVLAAGAYGHDRWKAGAGGCSYTFATSGKDTTITISAGSLMQVIEDKDVEGGIYRLSHAGTAQARIAVNGAATAGAYAATPLSSATATGNQTITVEFTTGTVSKVQLEPGTKETPYERKAYQQDLAICQRYLPGFTQFSVGAEDVGWGGTTSTSQAIIGFTFKVTPRIPPTGIFTLGTATLTTMLTASAVTAVTFSNAGIQQARIIVTGTGTPYVASQPAILVAQSGLQVLFTGAEL